ncbi:hypothetical protein D9758_011914 [Tetrapyrgos nigripes]|uniref:Novel STAND NTPase 1 domain-containing protein n=1 Tax=Tetrapyrgos nigripes TaxID=182062 RepID=A0A8H5FR92_9AGAR|nr:hypothetical protein D9758_011914 [Tetrapyrgos nigripes]
MRKKQISGHQAVITAANDINVLKSFVLTAPLRTALSLNPNLFVDIMGSYWSDIGIPITRDTADGRTHQGILKRPPKKLSQANILTEDIALPVDYDDEEAIYRRLCHLPNLPGAKRRIKFLLCVLYSGEMICLIVQSTSKLDLWAACSIKSILVAAKTEQAIFEYLKVKWQEPHERVRNLSVDIEPVRGQRALLLNMPNIFSRQPKPKQKDAIPSGFDWSHAKTALSLAASVGKAAGISHLEGAAEIAIKIIEIVETMKKNKEDCISIARDITDLLDVIKDIMERGRNVKQNEILMKNVQKLESDLGIIKTKLVKISNRKTKFHVTSDAEIIKECKGKIKDYTDMFNTKANVNIWQNTGELLQGQEDIIGDTRELLEGHGHLKKGQEYIRGDIKEMMASIAKTHDQSNITYDDLERVTPTVSLVFFGREELVAEGVDHLVNNSQAFLAVLGAGGIGKTSIALHINNAPQVKTKYRKASYFLPCEVLPDAKLLLQGLIQRLGIEVGQGESQHKKLEDYFRFNTQSILLILDNFETPWNNDPMGIENLLGKLASFDLVSMVITMRGSKGPASLHWKRLGSETIPPLSLESAKRVFMEISGKKELEEENDIVETILNELDCVPLAITLIAKRAVAFPPKSLLRMWQKGKTKILKQGKAEGRLTSVNYSIELSTNLLEPHEAELLATICFLPDGVPDWVENLSEMLAGWEDSDQLINTLLENSLVYSQTKTIKVLAPIREYINGTGKNIQRGIALLESFYVSWLKQLSGTMQEKQEQIQPHILNITKILKEQANSVAKTLDVEAVYILTGFTKFYPLTLDILNNILDKWPGLNETHKVEIRFKKLYMLKWLAMWQEAEMEAKGMEQSMQNDLKSHATVMGELGDIYRLQDKYTEAAEMVIRAKDQFEQIGDQWGAAQSLQRLGEIYQMQSKYTEATEMLTKAQDQFEQIGDQLGAAQSLQDLGEIYRMQIKYTEAAEMVTKAKDQFEQIGDQLGAAQSLQSLGEIYRMQSKYTEAAEMLTTAKDQFEQIGDQLGVTKCLRSLGDIYQMQSKYTAAAEMLTTAKDQFEQIGDQQGAAQCIRSLGMIHDKQANYTQAVAVLLMAKAQFEKIGDPFEVAECMYYLGVSYRKQGLYEDGKFALADATLKFQSLGISYDAGWCLYEYGLIFMNEHQYSEARRKFEEARDAFDSHGESQNQVDMCNDELAYLDNLEQARDIS